MPKLTKSAPKLRARWTVLAHKFGQDFVSVKYTVNSREVVCVAVNHSISLHEFVLDKFDSVKYFTLSNSKLLNKWTVFISLN